MGPSPVRDPGEPERMGFGACFFLSYAHTPQIYPNNRGPDYWVQEFFHDLCNELVSLDPRWATAGVPGFMDHSIPGGAVWPRRLAEQLATCRVFMPLYSRAYFSSKFCGTEWAIFRERQMAHVAETGLPNEAIIPVLWQPIHHHELPGSTRMVQLASLGDSPLYLERGLFELIRLNREREYLSVVIRLAELINDTARKAAPPPGPLAEFDDSRRLFPEHPDSAAPGRRIHITVAAHDRWSAPDGREHGYYGEQPEDWNPYYPESGVPLLARAEDVARELGYVPTSRADAADEDGDGPGILLVDPWMAEGAVAADALRRADRDRPTWVRPLIPWSRTDPQTRERAADLRAKLADAMPRAMGNRPTSRAATRDLGTIAQFGLALSGELDNAWSTYAKATALKPAPGSFPARPRLGVEPPAGSRAETSPEPAGDDNP